MHILHIFLTYSYLDSLKRDGVTSKNVKLIGHDFLSLMDNLFWYLPFASSKQAHGIREKAVPAVTEENWAEMYAAEHDYEGAHQQLAAGWNGWLSRTWVQRLQRQLRQRRLEEAGLVQNSWTIRLSVLRRGESGSTFGGGGGSCC